MKKKDILHSSKINEQIISIKKNVITLSNKGYAQNAEDFFNQMIKWQFQNKTTIKAIHQSLLEYVNLPKAVFAIRLYGSASKDKYDMLRRGFLSEYKNGLKTLFCDNTFAMPYVALKLHDKSYTASDLLEHLNQKNVVCSFGSTAEERELAYYTCTSHNKINLNTSGWYLAHILPVGYDFKDKQRLSKIFRNPNRSEWTTNTYHIRHTEKLLNDNERSILVAHFLRLIHPLNSFVIPKKNLVAYTGIRLGEEQELLNIVQNYIKNEFPKEYSELQEIMQIPEQEKAMNPVGEIIWSTSEYEITKQKNMIKQPQAQKITRHMKHVIDKYDEDEEDALANKLKSIGKAAFLKLYPLVKNNQNITIDEIEKKIPQYKIYSENAKRTRLSSTRSIIVNGLESEALEIIASSSRMSDAERQKAKKILETL